MTDAEQVACDALRSAGLGELADNLEWAREAAKVREFIVELLESDTDSCCSACGAMAGYTAHLPECQLAPLFATDPAWAARQVDIAHNEAMRMIDERPSLLGEWAQRQPGMMFTADPDRPGERVVVSPQVLEAYNREYHRK